MKATDTLGFMLDAINTQILCSTTARQRAVLNQDRVHVMKAIHDLKELELFKSEHLRLEAELNAILHPNGDGPTAPSFCDLVSYVRNDITHRQAATQLNLSVPFTPKLCGTCAHDGCGCSIQDSLLQIEPDATFDTFGCVRHEVRGVPVDDQSRILTLEAQSTKIHSGLVTLRRKHGVGIYCCPDAERSNGWAHSGKCKNWVLVY